MAKYNKPFIAPCAYCGSVEKLTADHVIPACLFEHKHAPPDVPIVYACQKCNNAKKNLDDSYLRDLLVTDAATSRHPLAQEIFNGPFLRAAQAKDRAQSPLAQLIQTHDPQPLAVMSKGGIYLGELFTFAVPKARLERIFLNIVRGLHFAYTGRPLPDSVQCEVNRVHDFDAARETVRTLMAQGGVFHKAGDGSVFQCVFAVANNRPPVSGWLMVFYQRIIFAIVTRDRAIENSNSTLPSAGQ